MRERQEKERERKRKGEKEKVKIESKRHPQAFEILRVNSPTPQTSNEQVNISHRLSNLKVIAELA